MTNIIETPLSDDELMALDTFLLSAEDDESMSIDEAHGYLTALIVGHSRTEQSEWLPAVWGSPVFSDSEEELKMTEMMQRLYNEIKATLTANKTFEPLVTEMEEDDEVFVEYEGWCFGFMMGLAQEADKWDLIPKEEQELLTPIGELALVYVEEASPVDAEDYETLVELIPGSVASLYRYWEQHSKAALH